MSRGEDVMKRNLLLALSIVILWSVATPAMADMIPLQFSYAWLDSSYNATTDVLTLSLHAGGSGKVTNTTVADGLSLFSLTMHFDNPAAGHTDTGSFTLTDTDGDTITGATGARTWYQVPGAIGVTLVPLSNVKYNGVGADAGKFNGTTGFVAIPANGAVGNGSLNLGPIETDKWFNAAQDWQVSNNGSADGSVVVPIPAAVLLGMLGLSAAGLGLRKIS
jgi:hypothetical protein